MNSQNEIWEQIKTFYRNKFGVAPDMVDIASVYDILKMCASGSGNKNMSKFLEMDENAIAEIIDAYLGHMGWENDLPFSPLRIYNGLDTKDIESFRNIVTVGYGYIHPFVLDNAFKSSEIVSKMERLIDEKWI